MEEKRLQGKAFWETLTALLTTRKLIIDRPKNQPHPRYPDLIYPLDYGYLEGTSAADGDGIDVWIGSLAEKTLAGILCSFDTNKNDAEIKLLLGCTPPMSKPSPSSIQNICVFCIFPTHKQPRRSKYELPRKIHRPVARRNQSLFIPGYQHG